MGKGNRARVVGSTSDQVAVRIYNQARKGTGYNPGLPVDLANLVVAQAKHETGDFTSNAFLKHNNAFGYAYYSGSNYQTGKGLIADNGQPVASYKTVEDSVKELIDWLNRRMREGKFPDLAAVHTPGDYAAALKAAGYYGDTLANYARGLAAFFKVITPAGGLGMVAILIGAAIYWYVNKR